MKAFLYFKKKIYRLPYLTYLIYIIFFCEPSCVFWEVNLGPQVLCKSSECTYLSLPPHYDCTLQLLPLAPDPTDRATFFFNFLFILLSYSASLLQFPLSSLLQALPLAPCEHCSVGEGLRDCCCGLGKPL